MNMYADVVLKGDYVEIKGELTGQTIDELFDKIEKLEKRVQELENPNKNVKLS